MISKRILLVCVVTILASQLVVFAQKPAKTAPKLKPSADKPAPGINPSTVLATVGGDPITYGELETAYKRNMNRKNTQLSNVRKDSVMDFLNLYVRYRLKVKDAYSRGLEKDSAVMAEVQSNRKLLSETFLYDKKVVEPNIEKYVERRKKEVQIGVIVIAIPQGENADTTAAYRKAMNCIKLVQNGGDFKKIASDSTEDKTNKENGGVLPYLTSLGGIIKPLEDAAYSLKPGQVYPEPVRARYVYLVVKLFNEQPKMAIRASQIIVPTFDGEDSVAVANRADSLVKALNGKPKSAFADAAKSLSQDKASADKGGDLGAYYTRSLGFEAEQRKLLPEFEDIMFSLKDGEVGKASTVYGWHIIRRDSTKTFNAETEKDAVKKLYKKYYFEDDKRTYLEETKKKLGFKWDEQNLNIMLEKLSNNKSTVDSNWYSQLDGVRDKAVYSMPGKSITIGAFADSLKKRSDMRGVSFNKNGLQNAMSKLSDPAVVGEAVKTLESEYADFAALIKEFKDGILLFKVEEQEVWGKLKFDSTAARGYYDTTKTRYQTEYKYDVSEIYFNADTTAKRVYDIANRTTTASAFEEIAAANTQRAGYKDKKGKWGVISVKNNKLAQLIDPMKPKAGDIIGPLPFEKGYTVVRVNAVETPRQKTFEEAIPDFAPVFQDLTQKRLSEEWLNKLKEKFAVSINTNTVNSLFK